MVDRQTPYLKLPYKDGLNDKEFRAKYNLTMAAIEAMTQNYVMDQRPADLSNYTFPDKRESTFDDTIFSPDTSRFELVLKSSRYLKVGNMFYYEIGVKSKVAIAVNSNGDISNVTVGTFNAGLPRKSGQKIYPVNYVAASYGYSGSSVILGAFGGMSIGTTIPVGTRFSFAGYFIL